MFVEKLKPIVESSGGQISLSAVDGFGLASELRANGWATLASEIESQFGENRFIQVHVSDLQRVLEIAETENTPEGGDPEGGDPEGGDPLYDLKVDKGIKEMLINAGLDQIEKIQLHPDLTKIKGIGKSSAEAISKALADLSS